jgi:hypothetical protein
MRLGVAFSWWLLSYLIIKYPLDHSLRLHLKLKSLL